MARAENAWTESAAGGSIGLLENEARVGRARLALASEWPYQQRARDKPREPFTPFEEARECCGWRRR